jgi:ribosomal protein S27AE
MPTPLSPPLILLYYSDDGDFRKKDKAPHCPRCGTYYALARSGAAGGDWRRFIEWRAACTCYLRQAADPCGGNPTMQDIADFLRSYIAVIETPPDQANPIRWAARREMGLDALRHTARLYLSDIDKSL